MFVRILFEQVGFGFSTMLNPTYYHHMFSVSNAEAFWTSRTSCVSDPYVVASLTFPNLGYAGQAVSHPQIGHTQCSNSKFSPSSSRTTVPVVLSIWGIIQQSTRKSNCFSQAPHFMLIPSRAQVPSCNTRNTSRFVPNMR
ncbi:MAG: hypothetical protein [Circoviridae sp.]|nr:MAG: hypothetical protein [Circoviridae sp.]